MKQFRVGSGWTVLVVCALLGALSACVVTRSGGDKLAPIESPVKRMAVLLQYGHFDKGNAASNLGNREVGQLFPQLATRIPVVFALNRIESHAAYVTSAVLNPQVNVQGYRHVMRMWPQAVTMASGGSMLTLGAELTDQEAKQVIWRGDVSFGVRFYGALDAAVADEVAAKLLAQLRSDGVIRLATAAPLTPAAASQAAATAPTKQHHKQVPPDSGFAAIDDADKVPVRAEGKDRYRHYLTLPAPKAFVVYPGGGWRFWSNDRNAMTNGLDACTRDGRPCWLYAVDNTVVWSAEESRRIGSSGQLLDK